MELLLLHYNTGQILAATNPDMVGLSKANEPFFVEGRTGTFIDQIRYEEPAGRMVMHISTPILDQNDKLVAVLAGHINLAEMTEIMRRASGMNPSEKSYLINERNRFVTQTNLGNKLTIEQEIHTDGVEDCLAQNNGTGFYSDYRGVPVIGAYRWIARSKACILTEIDQAEAYAPIWQLQMYILIAGGIIVILVGGASIIFTRHHLTKPIEELVKGAEEIGRGNLFYRITMNRSDEPGQLAAAFNKMAVQRQQMEWALRQARNNLERRVQERTKALRKSENKYRQLAETAEDMILTHTLDGRITYINPTGLELGQYSPEDIASMSIVNLVTPDAIPMLQSRREKRRQRDTSVFRFETDFVTKTGQTIPMEVMSSLMLRGDEPDEILILARDIRERKATEQVLAERAAELAESNAELEQFAYIVSHDLQEPLRMVTSYLQLLEQRTGGKLDDDSREFIGFAMDGANHMKALINGLLMFSRVGTRGYPPAPINCEAILDRVISTLQLTISDRQAVITRDPLPTVMADGFQLEQLFQNLLNNALKFNTASSPQIYVGVLRQKGVWRFWVQDNGIGIEPAYHQQIFDVFKRLHTRDEYAGTGIGLAICKKIVERHDGRIWVESQPGQGATFFFTLPANPAIDSR
jgi:PAS domain S-box-containing protein